IEVRAHRAGEAVVLQVLDEGDGIPAADLERVFDKFYRVRAADRQRAGTGLGLAICRGFVEAMGGRIAAANRTGPSGAGVTITLPTPPLPTDLFARAAAADQPSRASRVGVAAAGAAEKDS